MTKPRPSHKEAIREKCMDCSGWQKLEVQRCTVTSCSLFTLRPFMSVESSDKALQMRKEGVHRKIWVKDED